MQQIDICRLLDQIRMLNLVSSARGAPMNDGRIISAWVYVACKTKINEILRYIFINKLRYNLTKNYHF